eukprot:scaffold34535_cov27-Phaeocystis_antarctica.AAC.1
MNSKAFVKSGTLARLLEQGVDGGGLLGGVGVERDGRLGRGALRLRGDGAEADEATHAGQDLVGG